MSYFVDTMDFPSVLSLSRNLLYPVTTNGLFISEAVTSDYAVLSALYASALRLFESTYCPYVTEKTSAGALFANEQGLQTYFLKTFDVDETSLFQDVDGSLSLEPELIKLTLKVNPTLSSSICLFLNFLLLLDAMQFKLDVLRCLTKAESKGVVPVYVKNGLLGIFGTSLSLSLSESAFFHSYLVSPIVGFSLIRIEFPHLFSDVLYNLLNYRGGKDGRGNLSLLCPHKIPDISYQGNISYNRHILGLLARGCSIPLGGDLGADINRLCNYNDFVGSAKNAEHYFLGFKHSNYATLCQLIVSAFLLGLIDYISSVFEQQGDVVSRVYSKGDNFVIFAVRGGFYNDSSFWNLISEYSPFKWELKYIV